MGAAFFVVRSKSNVTRFVIANTSLDPYGTPTERELSNCILMATSPKKKGVRPLVTETIPTGDHLEFMLSQRILGFKGYVFAIANSQYCYGMAFINRPDGSSHSYQAAQIDTEGRSRHEIVDGVAELVAVVDQGVF